MKTITESIYNGPSCVVALAEVQHCERLKRGPYPPRTTEPEPNGLYVITSKTRYDFGANNWSNPVYIPESEAQEFLAAWCRYRSELEAGAPNIDSIVATETSETKKWEAFAKVFERRYGIKPDFQKEEHREKWVMWVDGLETQSIK